MTLNCWAHTTTQPVMPGQSSDMAMACWKGRRIHVRMVALPDIERCIDQLPSPSRGLRQFSRRFVAQWLPDTAQRLIDRDHRYIDGRFRLRNGILSIQLRALRVQ